MNSQPATAILQHATAQARRRCAQHNHNHGHRQRGPAVIAPLLQHPEQQAPATTIFEPTADNQVATCATIDLACPFCGHQVLDERITLIEFPVGGVVFHTTTGHQLWYRGRFLWRLDCGQPVTVEVHRG
ncbi:MAG: hypothetical protein KKA73_09070 [Chloroflexi bacterium]|nr:hypothetical protein [Chloroflexota bacterium]MBU1747829.1 hypothetical protein [Chloroflexota bacterium]